MPGQGVLKYGVSMQEHAGTPYAFLLIPSLFALGLQGGLRGLRGRGGLHWNMEVYRLRARSTSWRRARRSHSLRQQTHNALEGPLPLLFPALRIPVSFIACVPPDEGCTQ